MEVSDDGAGKAKAATPPYVSFRTVKTFEQDLHDHGIPGVIDKDVLKRFSGSVGKQLVTALRFLGLIDAANKPTAPLRVLTECYNTDKWAGALRELITDRYAPIFAAVDLETTTPSQLHNAFKAAYPGGADDVLKKSETFFLQAAKEAGIPLSKRLTVISRQRLAIKRKPGNGGSKPDEDTTDRQAATEEKGRKRQRNDGEAPIDRTPYQMLIDILDPVAMDDEEAKAVWTLIQYLKKRETENLSADEEED
jgi:hypothetical protein